MRPTSVAFISYQDVSVREQAYEFQECVDMRIWAVVLGCLVVVAGIIGFTNVAPSVAHLGRVLMGVFVVLLGFALFAVFRGR